MNDIVERPLQIAMSEAMKYKGKEVSFIPNASVRPRNIDPSVPPASPSRDNNDIIRKRIMDYGLAIANGCRALGTAAIEDTEAFTLAIVELLDKRGEAAKIFKDECDEVANTALAEAQIHADRTANGNERLRQIFDVIHATNLDS